MLQLASWVVVMFVILSLTAGFIFGLAVAIGYLIDYIKEHVNW